MNTRTFPSHLPQAALGGDVWVRGQRLSLDEAHPGESEKICGIRLPLLLGRLKSFPLTPALSPNDKVVGGEGVIQFNRLCS